MEISQTPKTVPEANRDVALRKVAMRLETTFLAEMLKHAGLGQARDSFGGGVGEDHFASMLAERQAEQLTAQGGIGLAEHIFQSLKEKDDD